MPEVAFSVAKSKFLAFVTLLSKCGIEIVACNEHQDPALVWIKNSTLLQTQLSTTPDGLCCGGFLVEEHSKPRGKLLKTLRNATYLDVLQFCEQVPVSSWSPPTYLAVNKRVYR